jgi:EpsI family protein
MTDSIWRFALAALLIGSGAIFLQARQHDEVIPQRLQLENFPEQLGSWTGTDIPIEKDELDKLGSGDFLLRDYTNPAAEPPYVNLFIAYFSSQRSGDTIHSPQHCIPGAGWTPVENHRIQLSMPGHEPFPVNRYVFAKGNQRDIALYWYWAHDRGIASEYWAKYYLVADSLKMNRSDGAMVRIIATMYPGETAEAAEQRLLPFVNMILPLQNEYIPR